METIATSHADSSVSSLIIDSDSNKECKDVQNSLCIDPPAVNVDAVTVNDINETREAHNEADTSLADESVDQHIDEIVEKVDKLEIVEASSDVQTEQTQSSVNPDLDSNECFKSMVAQPTISSVIESTINQEKTCVYKMKTIKWCNESVPIITQNENGPCPLIAIVNVLLLNSKKSPFGSKLTVTSEDLTSYLGEMLLQNAPQNYASEGVQLNFEKNMADSISVFPKLQTGLDVNVKFTGVKDFEYTMELVIFDLLNIPLYHGWLFDPENKVANVIQKLSYNQLVEKIITNKSSSETDTVEEALLAEQFLEESASQLTHFGLRQLNSVIKSNEIGVLFRNNHFSTVYKNKLVTDQGFLHEGNVVWETLSNVDGNEEFVDAFFITVPPKPAPVGNIQPLLMDPINQEEQIKQDFLVALSLQKEETREEEIAANWEEYKVNELGITSEVTDEELAWRLHEDEQKQAQENETRRAAAAQNANEPLPKQQSSTDPNAGHSSKKKSDCTIL